MGGKMGKVLDINARLNLKNYINETISHHSQSGDLLDITEARQEILSRDRRAVKRTILTEFIGAMIVLPEKGLLKVALHDISESGLAFEIDMDEGTFLIGEEVAMRVYLNQKTYFAFTVCISNRRFIDENRTIRHGTNFVKGSVNDVALHHFIKFIENISAILKTDSGDVLVSQIS